MKINNSTRMDAKNSVANSLPPPFCGAHHLTQYQRVNFGAYYTAPAHIQAAWEMLGARVDNAIVLDNACGDGGFLRAHKNNIGCDIDQTALNQARAKNPHAVFMHANALENVSRQKFNIAENTPLIIIGNPPFNDRTSQIRQHIKSTSPSINIDADIKTRDLGISFLLSFDKLRADWVCVLHPLSYLQKPTNFARLGNFAQNYALKKAKIISSATFANNSPITAFPIVIGLYARNKKGMCYEDIKKFRFATDGASFAIDDFQYLNVRKYPRLRTAKDLPNIMFYTMRDINALKRNRTFIFNSSANAAANAVWINREQLPYYIYADVFKHYLRHIPYYFGNGNIMINDKLFCRNQQYFMADAARRHPQLKKYIGNINDNIAVAQQKIEIYFRRLLGEHYEN